MFTPKHIIRKLSRAEKQSLRAAWNKRLITYKGSSIRITADFYKNHGSQKAVG